MICVKEQLSVMHSSCFSVILCPTLSLPVSQVMESSGVNLTSIPRRSQAKHCDTGTLPQFTLQCTASATHHAERERLGTTAGERKWKRSEDKRKKEMEGGRWDASIHSVFTQQNEGLISERHLTQHAHRQSWHAHEDESNTRRGEGRVSRLQDQSTTAFTVETPDQMGGAPSIMHLSSAHKTDGVITVAGQQGSAVGRCRYLSPALQRNTSSPSNASQLAFTSFFNNSLCCTPSHPLCEKLLIGENNKLPDKLCSRHFTNRAVLYSHEQWNVHVSNEIIVYKVIHHRNRR